MEGHDWERTAEKLAHFSIAMLAAENIESVHEQILIWTKRIVPPSQYVGLSRAARGGHVRSVAATGCLPRQADDLQDRTREGPCHDALWHDNAYHSSDLARERRWPTYAPAAAHLGIRSAMGFPLSTEEGTLGALNLYSSRPHAFDGSYGKVAAMFAAHAAVAYRWARIRHTLQSALESRQTIGEAVGLVAGRLEMDLPQAFAVLQRLSQESNTRLRNLAEQVIQEEQHAIREGSTQRAWINPGKGRPSRSKDGVKLRP